ncbi:hypothetical protein F0562_025811 [Nyssa sinensis]|uniref:TF-B3 domain-containing protein n=1 Tax=Nyssa sinensis TaxID=561372 RepID=A0A5J5B8V0_9ASTE|nr:hypothetical protein F0562_025811 [Nyssa sinensis]
MGSEEGVIVAKGKGLLTGCIQARGKFERNGRWRWFLARGMGKEGDLVVGMVVVVEKEMGGGEGMVVVVVVVVAAAVIKRMGKGKKGRKLGEGLKMAGHQPEELCFTKILSDSDVKGCLELPAENLLTVDEVMLVRDGNGGEWKFKVRQRNTGRRYMAKGWSDFTRDVSARAGDRLNFYRLANFNLLGQKVCPYGYLVTLERA